MCENVGSVYLLRSDEGKTDKAIAELMYISDDTIARIRQRFCEIGISAETHSWEARRNHKQCVFSGHLLLIRRGKSSPIITPQI